MKMAAGPWETELGVAIEDEVYLVKYMPTAAGKDLCYLLDVDKDEQVCVSHFRHGCFNDVEGEVLAIAELFP